MTIVKSCPTPEMNHKSGIFIFFCLLESIVHINKFFVVIILEF